MTQVTIRLPYPPSVNTVYRHAVRGKHSVMFMTDRGKDYKKQVEAHVRSAVVDRFGDARLSMLVHVYPPDRRKRDLDNLSKVLADSLQGAGLFKDDEQIDDVHYIRKEVIKGGAVVVRLTSMDDFGGIEFTARQNRMEKA